MTTNGGDWLTVNEAAKLSGYNPELELPRFSGHVAAWGSRGTKLYSFVPVG